MRSVVPDTQHAGRVGVAEARREANAFYCQATLFLLTLVNSYTDVITLTRWQCFGSMMTGNTLYIGWAWHNPYVAEIQTVTGATWKDTHQYQRIYPGLYYVLIIAAFLLGVVLHRHAEKRCPSYAAGVVATPLALLMGASELLLCFGVVQPKGQQRLYYLGILCVAPIFGVMWCSLTLSLTPSLPPSLRCIASLHRRCGEVFLTSSQPPPLYEQVGLLPEEARSGADVSDGKAHRDGAAGGGLAEQTDPLLRRAGADDGDAGNYARCCFSARAGLARGGPRCASHRTLIRRRLWRRPGSLRLPSLAS